MWDYFKSPNFLESEAATRSVLGEKRLSMWNIDFHKLQTVKQTVEK